MFTPIKAAALVRDRMPVGQAAEYLGIAAGTLNRFRHEGRGPRFLRLGNRVFYLKDDLDAYLNARLVETADTRAIA